MSKFVTNITCNECDYKELKIVNEEIPNVIMKCPKCGSVFINEHRQEVAGSYDWNQLKKLVCNCPKGVAKSGP
jgi:predicted nucleic-acid-binding Zn-ribbon protein